MKIGMVSLGCAKNLVDSEYILGLLRQDKTIKVIDDIEASDAIFINTCGFINDAKKEAIDTIFSVLNQKRKDAYVIVIGCLAKRYKKELEKDIPEIDLVVGVDEWRWFVVCGRIELKSEVGRKFMGMLLMWSCILAYVFSPKSNETILKSTPLVVDVSSLNTSSIKRVIILVLPVALSPIKETLNKKSYEIFNVEDSDPFFKIFIESEGLFSGISIILFWFDKFEELIIFDCWLFFCSSFWLEEEFVSLFDLISFSFFFSSSISVIK